MKSKHVTLPMICDCKEEGQLEAAKLMTEVYLLLGPEVTPSNFLTNIVHVFERDFEMSITGIYADMWCIVHVETYKKADDGKPLYSISVECDKVEHGLAAAWKHLADNKTTLT